MATAPPTNYLKTNKGIALRKALGLASEKRLRLAISEIIETSESAFDAFCVQLLFGEPDPNDDGSTCTFAVRSQTISRCMLTITLQMRLRQSRSQVSR